MWKPTFVVLLSLLISCTPYQRLLINPSNRQSFLNDSCDLKIVSQFMQMTDDEGGSMMVHQSVLLQELEADTCCEYYSAELFSRDEEDSTRWLMMIRPVYTGKDQIIVGSLYRLYPSHDSVTVFERRIKEYSQIEKFERGKYLGFTYHLTNDSPTIIKLGTNKYD